MVNYPLVAIIENAAHSNRAGCIKVYDNEHEAEEMLPQHKGGIIVCCGGYYNGIFIPYRE